MNKDANYRKFYEAPTKIIKLLIKNGFKIKPLKKWSDFLQEKYKDDENLRSNSQKVKSNLNQLKEYYFEIIKTEFTKLKRDLDLDKAIEVIVREQSLEFSNKNGFINNGFVIYLNQRIFEIDMTQDFEILFYKLIFEWHDLPEEKREIYREMAKIKFKNLKKDFNSLREGLINEDDLNNYDEM